MFGCIGNDSNGDAFLKLLEEAKNSEKILEAKACVCDANHNLIVDLGGVKGIIPREDGALGIKDGDRVRVTSRIGSFETTAQVMHPKEIFKGSMQHTHGFVDENVNEITYDDVSDPISGFPVLKSIQVKVEKI